MLASDVLVRASTDLLDPDQVRWPTAELLRDLSDGLRLLAVHKPDALATTGTWLLAAGAEQELPDEAELLLDVLGATHMDVQALDRFQPGWRTGRPGRAVQHFAYDLRDPRRFTVYPPAIADTEIDAVYVQKVEEITQTTTVLPARDAYMGALADYVVFRAYIKDSDDTLNQQRAGMHLQLVSQALGVKLQMAMAVSPKANSAPREGMK